MAFLYITEYSGTAAVNGNIPNVPGMISTRTPQEPELASQKLGIGGSPVPSAPFQNSPGKTGSQTYLIRVHTDSICSILIGTNPTASANNRRLAANQTEFFGVSPGQILSVITNV